GQDVPEIKQEGAIRYAMGGVGEDERAAMEAMRKDFNLELTFAAKGDGNFLADVDLAIRDARDRVVLGTRIDAPIVLAQLPPGRYTVSATFNGETQTRKVSIGKGQRAPVRTALYWYDPTVQQAGVPPEPGRASRGGR